ncbi:MAG: hypothetical protein M3619_02475 [Myxococcota bacterium]|nr:hypothetical protein [Myxococcota bacterium]
MRWDPDDAVTAHALAVINEATSPDDLIAAREHLLTPSVADANLDELSDEELSTLSALLARLLGKETDATMRLVAIPERFYIPPCPDCAARAREHFVNVSWADPALRISINENLAAVRETFEESSNREQIEE